MGYYQVLMKKEKLVSNGKWDEISFDDDIPLPTDVRSSDKYPWAKFPPPNLRRVKQDHLLLPPIATVSTQLND